jgi:Cu2+-exporting ATPase
MQHHGHHDHHGHGGHDGHAGHDPDVFRKKFWLTLAVTIPIVITATLLNE